MTETLQERIRARGPRPWGEALRVMRGVSLAIGQAHLRKRGHGGISAATVSLLPGEGARTLRVIMPPASASNVADLPWEAIENVTGWRRPTPASDVWALGLVAYVLLAGRMLWRSVEPSSGRVLDPVALVAEMRSPPRACERAREQRTGIALPASFDGWLARCLATDPSERFPSGPKAVAALETVRPRGLGLVAPVAVVTARPRHV